MPETTRPINQEMAVEIEDPSLRPILGQKKSGSQVYKSPCLTHFRIVQSVGPNSLDRSPYLRPAQTNSTICLRNSAGYFVPLFAIADSFSVDTEVSTKAGQAHFRFGRAVLSD